MTGKITIHVSQTELMVEVVAGLVREGIVHIVTLNGHNWEIELTGGF